MTDTTQLEQEAQYTRRQIELYCFYIASTFTLALVLVYIGAVTRAGPDWLWSGPGMHVGPLVAVFAAVVVASLARTVVEHYV